MSDDIIKRLRGAIAAGPTPGPWCVYPETDGTEICAVDDAPGLPIRAIIASPVRGANWISNGRYIAAASPDNIAALLDRLDAAERENERLREDAERYRWLRGREDGRYMTVYAFRTDVDEVCLGDDLDAAIDAAMAAEQSERRGK